MASGLSTTSFCSKRCAMPYSESPTVRHTDGRVKKNVWFSHSTGITKSKRCLLGALVEELNDFLKRVHLFRSERVQVQPFRNRMVPFMVIYMYVCQTKRRAWFEDREGHHLSCKNTISTSVLMALL